MKKKNLGPYVTSTGGDVGALSCLILSFPHRIPSPNMYYTYRLCIFIYLVDTVTGEGKAELATRFLFLFLFLSLSPPSPLHSFLSLLSPSPFLSFPLPMCVSCVSGFLLLRFFF